MRITVVGGNRGTGAHVVRLAARAGHEVTVLSRTGSEALPDGVVDRRGDATDPDTVRRAVAGADAVVVTVGGGTANNRAAVTEAAVDAMRQEGVRRLVVQSSLGVGDSMALMPAPARLFARTVLRGALADHGDQEATVRASGLDWTVVRPGGLTDGRATGNVVAQETAEGRPMQARISREDVAAYIVRILDDARTYGRALALGG